MRIKTLCSLFVRANTFIHSSTNVTVSSLTLTRHFSKLLNFSNWDIVGAVCLERKPLLTQPLTPLEKKYSEYLQKLELEKSLLSEHEKRLLLDVKSAEKYKKGELEELDVISTQTAQDFEDASLEQLKKYQPISRTTEADQNNDRSSLQRKLDSSLVFVINQKVGNDFNWMLPQAIHKEGETLRQTAERALHSVCASQVNVMFLGNAPFGYYKYKYPKAARTEGACGAKVFFFKAQLLDKRLPKLDISVSDTVTDAMWLTHSELGDVVKADYGKTIQSFLLPNTYDVHFDESPTQYCDDEEPDLKTSALN